MPRTIEGLVFDNGPFRSPGEIDVVVVGPDGRPASSLIRARRDGRFAVEVPDELLVGGAEPLRLEVRRRGQVVGSAVCRPQDDQAIRLDLQRVGAEADEPLPVFRFEVAGRVLTDRRTVAAGVVVEAYDRMLAEPVLLGRATTDHSGRYLITYDAGQLRSKPLADLVIRVTTGGQQPVELARSATNYAAAPLHTVDVSVAYDRVPRASERTRLLDAMAVDVSTDDIGGLTPDAVTYVANRAGWDPRLVAMSVAARRAAARTELPESAYYAAFRSGAANTPEDVHRMSPLRFGQVLDEAVERGVIDEVGDRDRVMQRHGRLGHEALLAQVPVRGVSSIDALLSLRLDDQQKDRVVDALHATRDEPQQLWARLEAAQIDRETIDRLRLDGKLGALTRHNAPVMGRLIANVGVTQLADLVTARLYEVDAWESVIGADTPEGVAAEDYATGLAIQVRLAFPTRVIAHQLRRGVVAIGDQGVADGVAGFLERGADARQLGLVPLRRWDGFDDLDEAVRDGALLLERLHQITPSDASLRALAHAGLSSARDVVTLSEAEFLAKHGDAFPSREEAVLVHRKAHQVHSTVLHIATDYMTRSRRPTLAVLAGPTPRGD
ncbi:MAG: hypothetical protein M3N57_02855 [Actinomycetota bacterium]|nr:hypothetical protein [Actinomycetota bacterium]